MPSGVSFLPLVFVEIPCLSRLNQPILNYLVDNKIVRGIIANLYLILNMGSLFWNYHYFWTRYFDLVCKQLKTQYL